MPRHESASLVKLSVHVKYLDSSFFNKNFNFAKHQVNYFDKMCVIKREILTLDRSTFVYICQQKMIMFQTGGALTPRFYQETTIRFPYYIYYIMFIIKVTLHL